MTHIHTDRKKTPVTETPDLLYTSNSQLLVCCTATQNSGVLVQITVMTMDIILPQLKFKRNFLL